jgi:hypothetical protein
MQLKVKPRSGNKVSINITPLYFYFYKFYSRTMKKKARTKAVSGRNTPDFTIRLAFIVLGSFIVLILSIVLLNLHANTLFCANSVSCTKNITGEKEQENTGVFMGKNVTAPTNMPENNPMMAMTGNKAVLGTSTGDYKHIYVDLSNQALYAYEGSNLIYAFPVSTGKWHRTPTGDFRIWVWLRYTRMTGGDKNKGTYYDLPNVPYTMFFNNDNVAKTAGYSIHGAYWHNNFGHVMSHGCVNMKTADVAKIFYWTNPLVKNVAYPDDGNPGTLITIYGTPPSSETNFID